MRPSAPAPRRLIAPRAACFAALAALALAASLWPTPALSQAPGPLKIGVLLPLSGKHKRLGGAILDAVSLTRSVVKDVDFTVADTGGTAEGARREVERLALDLDVVALLGPVGWEEARAAAVRAQQLGLPIISLSNQEGIEAIGDLVFRGRPSVQEQARLMATVAVNEMKIERFAILYPDDELGQSAAMAFFEQARGGGGRVMAMSSYAAGETNLQKAVEALVSRRAPKLAGRSLARPPTSTIRQWGQVSRVDFDAIFVPDYDDSIALACRFLRFNDVPLPGLDDGITVQLLGTAHMHGPRLADSEGLVSGALYPELFALSHADDQAAAFARIYAESFGREPVDIDAQVVDLYGILADRAREARAAGLSGQQARRAAAAGLVQMKDYEGLTGKQRFAADRSPIHAFEIWVVNANGEVAPSF